MTEDRTMKWALIQGEGCDRDTWGEEAAVGEKMTYTVFSEEIDSPSLGRYRTCSIAVTDAEGLLVRTVHDITPDREALEALAALCNELELSLCHLDDVIEDFLS